MIVYYLGYCTL